MSLVGVTGAFALMILPVFVGAYAAHRGFDEDVAGWIAATNLAGLALMTLIVSLKTRHWPLERVAGCGLAAMILFDALTLFAHSLPAFLAVRFLSGMGGGAAQAAAAAALARLAHSNRGYGIYIGAQFLIPAVALYELPIRLPEIGFDGMMQALIGLEVVALLVVPVLANYPIPEPAGGKSADADVLEIRLILRRPALLSISALCIYGAANAAIWAYAERMGVDTGLSSEGIGTVFLVVSVVSVLGAGLVCWVQDRFGHLRPLCLGIGCQIAAMLLLIGLPSTVGFVLGIGLFSTAWAFTWPYFLSIQADIDGTGTVVVAGQFGNLVGNALGPALAALVVGGGYASVVRMVCVLFVVSALPILAIYRAGPLATSARERTPVGS